MPNYKNSSNGSKSSTKSNKYGSPSSTKNSNNNSNLNSKKSSNKNRKTNSGKNGSKVVATSRDTMHLYYMTERKVDISTIMECLIEETAIVVQIWDTMGVAQVEWNDKERIDIEDIGMCFQSKEDLLFIEKNNIQTIFEVVVEEQDFSFAKQLFYRIVTHNGGFFCTDSDDFKPIYTQSMLEG